MSSQTDVQPRSGIGLIAAVTAVGVAIACALVLGVVGYHAVIAERARDVPVDPKVRATFEEASRSWISHVDVPVRRLVLTSAEEYGIGTFLFVFDVYTWTGVGSGFVTAGSDIRAAVSGGLLRDGGFAGIGQRGDSKALAETRRLLRDAYGPGRVLAPGG